MSKNTKKATMPTRNVSFDNGILHFDIRKGCAYHFETDSYVGGDWTRAHIKTNKGESVFIRLSGNNLIIEKLTECRDDGKKRCMGGKFVEIARFNVTE